MKKKYLKIVGGGRSHQYKPGCLSNYKLERVNERKCRGFDLFRD